MKLPRVARAARLPAALPYDRRSGLRRGARRADPRSGRRRARSDREDMFGGLAFLIGGNMAVAASGQGGALVRVDPVSGHYGRRRPRQRAREASGCCRSRSDRDGFSRARRGPLSRPRVRLAFRPQPHDCSRADRPRRRQGVRRRRSGVASSSQPNMQSTVTLSSALLRTASS